jgi:hypothetical protein
MSLSVPLLASLASVRTIFLSIMQRGKVELGAVILLRMGWEFGKSLEWLLARAL